MKRMKYVFRNLFLSSQYSLANMIAFTTDLIERLSANNPGHVLDGQIAALTEALAILNQQSSADFAMLGIRKGAKLRKNAFRGALGNAIRRIYAIALAEFGDPSEEMENIFPKGRTVFDTSRDDRLIEPLDGLVSGLTLHEAELGADVVAEATALRDEWLEIHESSEEATGVKTATEAERREARYNLAVELHRTVGVLISLFPEDEERYALYMQQHLLGGPATDTPPPVGGGDGDDVAVPPGSHAGSGSSGSGSSMGSSGSGSSIGSSSSMASSTSSFSTVTSGSSTSTSSSMAPGSSSAGSSSSV